MKEKERGKRGRGINHGRKWGLLIFRRSTLLILNEASNDMCTLPSSAEREREN